MKVALITGVTGQDGFYLAELLLKKGYIVYGMRRRSSSFESTWRIDNLLKNHKEFTLEYGDLTDSLSLINVIKKTRPTEIYNLAAQSHVGVSFLQPEYTAQVDGLGVLRILEAVRILGMIHDTRIYQASTSELYGKVLETPQSEKTPFYPRSPYAVAKLYAYWTVVNYREAYDMYACNGILFNHESPIRGENFVTRKITRGLSRAYFGISNKILLGNLNSSRDWGHARDYVEMQYRMLQQTKPLDYVIATGVQYSVRDFIKAAAGCIGISIHFVGDGSNEKGIIVSCPKDSSLQPGQIIVEVANKHFRPTEVETLLGDASAARNKLGWKPQVSFEALVKEMMDHDMESARGLAKS